MALVLKRKPGEEIVIDGRIKVSILDVKEGRAVSVAVTAPKEVVILRAEIAPPYDPEPSADRAASKTEARCVDCRTTVLAAGT